MSRVVRRANAPCRCSLCDLPAWTQALLRVDQTDRALRLCRAHALTVEYSSRPLTARAG
jgi:hypothetical protein